MQAAFAPQAPREREEKSVDRRAPRNCGWAPLHAQLAVHHGELGSGRDDVHVVRLDRHPIFGLDHRHLGATAEQLCEHALVIGREVLDRNKGQAGVRRRAVQEFFEYVEATGRPADPDDRADPASAGAYSCTHLSPAT